MSRMWLMSGWTSSAQVSHSGWTIKLMKPTWGKQVTYNSSSLDYFSRHTCDFSTLALSLSHMADTSSPSAFSWKQANVKYPWILWLVYCAHPVSLGPELVHQPVHPLLVQLQRLGRVAEVGAVHHVLENLQNTSQDDAARQNYLLELPESCR